MKLWTLSRRVDTGVVVLAGALAGCVEREPLGTQGATESATGETGPGMTGGSTGAVTTTGSDSPTTGGVPETTGDGPETTDTEGTAGAPSTGEASLTEGTTGASGEPASGLFLFAVATSLAPDLPLQFIATNTVAPEGMQLRIDLQPLALAQGSVTQPREPVGELLSFPTIPVDQGSFELDAGVVAVAGAANPVTGGDLEARLILRGSFVSDDVYCGQVEGELLSPLQASLAGSTFAAVRIADPMALPLAVPINCSGDTATDS